MVTLAHEAGHAWHSCVLRPTRSFASNYPMTLAETASNFGEMILLDGLLNQSSLSPEMKAYLLDQEMLRAHAYLINIPMRYEFEHSFYSARAAGEVPVSRLRELMNEAQRSLYGDTLLPDGTDPMFWASKMHFFITGVSFYNFPYVFGYLLGQALFARFKLEGDAFLPKYEAFLAATGNASCEDVAMKTLGADLTSPDFWATALRSIVPTLEAYEKLPTRQTATCDRYGNRTADFPKRPPHSPHPPPPSRDTPSTLRKHAKQRFSFTHDGPYSSHPFFFSRRHARSCGRS
jgi:oligoendopeptidase F